MNLFSLSGILIGISSFTLGIFAFLKNIKNKVNQVFLFFATAVAIWGFGGWQIGLAKDPISSLFWWKISFIGVIFIPIFLYNFVLVFLDIKEKTFLSIVYLIGLFFLILELSPLSDLFFGLANMTFFFSSFYWIFPATPLYTIFFILWVYLVVYSLYLLYVALKKSSGLKYTQIKYFFLAMAIGFAGGTTCFLLCFGVKLYPILNFTVPLYPAILAYSITRYHLMDIRIAVRKSVVYIVAAVFA